MSAKYFNDIRFNLPEFTNPADTYMRILAVSFPKTPKDLRKLSFFNAQYKKRIGNFIDQEHAQIKLPAPVLDGLEHREAGVGTQMRLLIGRNRLGL